MKDILLALGGQEIMRFTIIGCTMILVAFIARHLIKWHMSQDEFNFREYFTAVGSDGKQHASRPALQEMVALAATTSGYLGTLAVRPQDYEACTLVYGGIWVVRGGYSTYLRSKRPDEPKPRRED